MAKELWKGNEAIAEAAIRAGCRCYFGYPITPQSEIPEYMAKHMPAAGGVFLQSESEIAAINMVYGASGAGARVMTSSSSPGISLKQEGISYLCGAELPAVIVNVMRGGPGLGTIQAAQGDYFQATRGGGNGDYRLIVLAPATIQEVVDLMQDAFDLADKYRIPVMMLLDGMIGQMMEPVEWTHTPAADLPEKSWATTGTNNERPPNIINSLFIDPDECNRHNLKLEEKYRRITENEQRFEITDADEAEVLFVAYGTPARLARAAARLLGEEGIKAGVFRPISVWPYPYDALHEAAGKESVKAVVTVELSTGQMVDDVRIAVNGIKPVHFIGQAGGVVPTPREVADAAKKALGR
ncbi:MAG TPA: 3-methyl-2-oxobutanoate dehydrogenase subunit VorB [Clostridiaceae bacterium]|nr:3-methyl-2-oxobutanoate dehydrogenase subunit VorB [Clostridiaceae bacterium]